MLAFSVQGIADALTFRESRTGDLQTIVTGKEFTVSFSVSPSPGSNNTTPIKNATGDLVKDDGTTRIDSAGYEVFVASNNSEYRLSTAANALTETYVDTTGTTSTSGTLYVSGGSNYPGSLTKGSVVDDAGKPVYIKTGTDPNFTYPRAMAAPNVRVLDANRYHYNQEAISIAVPTGTTLTKVGTSYRVNVAGGSSHAMNELKGSVEAAKLTSSIRLTFTADAVGKKTITITDTTPDADRVTTIPKVPLSFTIFVVPDRDTTSLTLTGDGTDGYEERNDYADPRVDTLFQSGTNVPLVYSVVGSGRLYVEETYANAPTSKSSPTQTLSTSSDAVVKLDMNGSSNKVTAYVRDTNAAEESKTIYFIFQYAQIEIIGGNNKTGVPNARLINPLQIRVKDAKGRALSGLAVTFDPTDNEQSTLQPVIGTDVYLTSPPSDNTWASAFGNDVKPFTATATVPADPDADAAALVPTDRSGEAEVYLKLGGAGNKTVTVSAGGDTDTFYVTSSTSTDIPSLEIFSGNNQKSENDGKVADPLVVRVLASSSSPLPQKLVTFTTTKGYLTTPAAYRRATPTPATINGPATQVTAVTDVNGKAAVSYDLVNHSGASDVIAEISGTNPTYSRRETFKINGTGSSAPPTDNNTGTTPSNTPAATQFTVFPLSISGGVGSNQTLTITTPSGATAQVGNIIFGQFLNAGGSALPNTGSGTFQSTLTLPSTAGTYNLVVNVGSDRRTVPVTVSTTTTTTQTGTLRISNLPLSGAIGSQQVATVTATGSDGNPASGVVVRLSVTNGGGVFTPASVTTGTDGTATSTLTRGTTAGTDYFVTASATGYTSSPQSRIVITSATPTTGSTPTPTTTTPTTTTTTPTTPTAGTPNLILIDGEATRTGTVNEALDAPLVVEVLDSKGSRVRNARVIFRVKTGQGRLSQRGNGRAIADNTDSQGNARANYTPMSASSTVSAEVRGVAEKVTFTITTDGSVPPTTTTPDTTTPATTTPDPADVTLKVDAANRPVMYWITGGALYRQATGDATQIAASAKDVVVDTTGGKVYWITKTSERSGNIHTANLDGSNTQVLKTLTSVPMGLALDTANNKLYLTNSWGKIQRMNLDGTQFETNFITGLSNPMHIAASGGNVYWTEGSGTLGFAVSSGAKSTLVTGAGAIGGIVADSSNVYWTEQTGERSGRIRSANLDGDPAISTVFTITAVTHGIAIDPATGSLYWTNGWGKIQTGASTGGGFKDVATGLMTPTALAIGGANTTTDTTPAKPATPTTAANKYDVNGDGTVDVKDSDALIVAVAAGVTDAKYDVNGDGNVDINDVIAVTANRNGGAAGAPTLLGTKFSALEVDRLQEQIDLLIATNDRSPAAMRTLVYLQQLIVMARPEKTQLLANYPNPFNPETWIPYELATDTDVTLTIYNAQGVVVRVLHLGQQSAGYYTDRERAAYWDGQNALGEQVASGIYFYQLETDDLSSLRKMVILK